MNKQAILSALNLAPHIEGGYFIRSYQSTSFIENRHLMTSIYYMLTDDSPIGYFHTNKSDVVHFFHLGSPILYLTISPEGQLSKTILGPDLSKGHQLQMVVKGGYWKASRLLEGEFGLLGEAVSPGFDYADNVIGEEEILRPLFPNLWETISSFVKK